MAIDYVQIGKLKVNRFIVGGNPFSGFSHQSVERDREMVRYYSSARIKEVLRQAESLGLNTFISRVDLHILRLFLEYREEGGKLQWFAQVDATSMGSFQAAISSAIKFGASACFIHGGHVDYMFANGQEDQIEPVLKIARDKGLPVGVAGHNPEVFKWAEKNINTDFYMCSHYNPTLRDKVATHIHGADEKFREEDRQAMVEVIRTLSKPVIHYKILAAGRNKPAEAFDYVAKAMKKEDAVCVGIYTADKPDMLKEDLTLFKKSLQKTGKGW